MNKTISLAAIAMVAVVMGMSAFAPAAMAAPNSGHGQTIICHYDFNDGVWESDKSVNPHALVAHLAHGDKVIGDGSGGTITVSACEALTPLS